MTDILPVIGLILLALIVAFSTYRGIRRGAARFYTLEREAILRRASFTLIATVVLFLGAIGYLLWERQQTQVDLAVLAGETVEGVPTLTPTISDRPPTETPTPTPDPDRPTPTATIPVCRAVVRGTAGSGLNLRQEPGGDEVETLPEESILTLLDEPPVESGGFTWIKVRTVTLNEGWVAVDFLFISDEACLERIGQ